MRYTFGLVSRRFARFPTCTFILTHSLRRRITMEESTAGESSKRARTPSPGGEPGPAAKKQVTEPTDVASAEPVDDANSKVDAPAGEDQGPKPTSNENKGGKSNAAKGGKHWKGKGEPRDRRERNGRDWDTPRPKKEGEGSDGEGNGEKRLPKKKVAVLIG